MGRNRARNSVPGTSSSARVSIGVRRAEVVGPGHLKRRHEEAQEDRTEYLRCMC